MTLTIIAASLEYAIARTPYHGALKAVKLAAALVLAWGFYKDQRLVFANWQMKLSRQMLLHVALLMLALLGFQASVAAIQILVRESNAYGPDSAQRLESWLQMAAYPFLIAASCLGTDGFAAWIKRNSKHLTMLLYLFVWVWFGSYYYYMASRTMGDDFVFSEQARIQATLGGLAAADGYDGYDEYRLKEILEKAQYKKDYLTMEGNAYLTLDATGIDWGEIYEHQFAREGYAFYSFEASDKALVIEPAMLDYDSMAAWDKELGKRYTEVVVKLYPAEEPGQTNEDGVRYDEGSEGISAGEASKKPVKSLTLYFAGQDYAHFMQIFGNHPSDRHLSRLIAASHTLPDGKFLELYVGINGYVNYRIEDFWYFSAITITTLGFGDITPNSGPVKVAVMIETLLGVLLVGIYVSLVSRKKRESG
ncbi:potassium channel family protein [Paenibacillus glycinis]|uniref:Potassium channel domain-containing protein n=1 Tax=Paenibacillus glycinis TaxID=2697035 RepID=A0ABW9XLS0_9BACL|nr:potassium channel family protein [Paenibacillus glycinis]NBD23543.1 hypothetical protein [Paenibacillus glycinis]